MSCGVIQAQSEWLRFGLTARKQNDFNVAEVLTTTHLTIPSLTEDSIIAA
jgi:hypothetical protein